MSTGVQFMVILYNTLDAKSSSRFDVKRHVLQMILSMRSESDLVLRM